MNKKKKIVFLTGTRADFGKIKSLVAAAEKEEVFDISIFVTGMHTEPKYGGSGTKSEVHKCGFKNVYAFINRKPYDSMDTVLANTVQGLGNYLCVEKADMLVIHGDRVEALAGAVVGALNNIIVAHIEGGEVSGTIDESIRHAVSKLAHLHFVANDEAKKRLIQMGEKETNIYVIGSPDIDLMTSSELPSLLSVKQYYDIPFDNYAIFIYHPVTTSLHNLFDNIKEVMAALVESEKNYIVIYPNNDTGSDIIIEEIERCRGNPHFRIFPSIRFESFLVLLKNSEFIIGNSSAGIREAPFYFIPTINIGNRQNGRFSHDTIINVNELKIEILNAIKQIKYIKPISSNHFGDGKSTEKFIKIIKNDEIW